MSNIINEEAYKAFEFIQNGGVILYPTDTIWGLGCDATNCEAVDRINNIKKRSVNTPLLSLVKDVNMILKYTNISREIVEETLSRINDATTVIYPGGKNLCEFIFSKDKSVGLRIPENKFCLKLISFMNTPLVSTSANIHKEPFPGSFKEINNDILKQVDYIVNLPNDNWSTKASKVLKLDKLGNLCKIR